MKLLSNGLMALLQLQDQIRIQIDLVSYLFNLVWSHTAHIKKKKLMNNQKNQNTKMVCPGKCVLMRIVCSLVRNYLFQVGKNHKIIPPKNLVLFGRNIQQTQFLQLYRSVTMFT